MAKPDEEEILPCADCTGEGFTETLTFVRTEPDGSKRFECPRGHALVFHHK